MTAAERRLRKALLLGSALALAPLPVLHAPAVASDARTFTPPEGPLILTRELRRALGRTAEIITRRSYEIRFVPDGAGWRVDGKLVDSEVDAPAELAALAALEKARKDDGLFPLKLDAQGRIVEQRAPSDAAATLKARELANQTVEKIDMVSADKTVAKQMIQRIAAQSQGAPGSWPVDLFRPAERSRVDVREIPLPDGKQGRITVTMQASPNESGQLKQLDRRIVTEIDGTSRLSVESWSMSEVR
ncbi:hypothetical protein OKA06_03315 [Novosphingobium sp. MW5]|nr:hypothetical protein [Novosphingobium sp. MW5]